MNERIRILRKALGLTLEKFGLNLGVGKTAISSIEHGVNAVTEQMFKAICNVNWNGKLVNEEWLRTGTGNMFIELPEEDEVGIIVSQLIEEKKHPFYNIILESMRTFNQLTPENQAAFTVYCEQLLENLRKEKED